MKLRVACTKTILALTTIAVATSGLVLPQSAPAATTDRSFSPFGMASHPMWGYTDAAINAELDALKASGGHWLRFDAEWRNAEPTRGSYNATFFSDIDYIVSAAQSRGIEVQINVLGAPSWANGNAGYFAPPTDPAQFAGFIQKMVARYKGRIKYWEIWNEPNLSEFWEPGPDAAAFTRLLKASYVAAKQADPNVVVISGGLSYCDRRYLQEMYDAGAQGYFDLLGVHPYTGLNSVYFQSNQYNSEWNFDGIADMRATMDANGDAGKNIWASEIGWNTVGSTGALTEAQQAQYVTDAYKRLLDEFPYVEALIYYNLRNTYANADVSSNFGLLRKDFTKKPGYYAFQTAAKAFDAQQPSITLTPGTATVTIGGSTTLGVKVTPAAATAVTIERKNSTTGLWDSLATTTTPDNGTMSMSLVPTVSATYRATAPDNGLTSPAVTVKVRAKASVRASRLSVRRNRTVRFGGKILPGIRTTRVALQRRVGRRWVTVRRLGTTSLGAFSLRLRVVRRGRFVYRIYYYGNSSHLGASSRSTPLRVY